MFLTPRETATKLNVGLSSLKNFKKYLLRIMLPSRNVLYSADYIRELVEYYHLHDITQITIKEVRAFTGTEDAKTLLKSFQEQVDAAVRSLETHNDELIAIDSIAAFFNIHVTTLRTWQSSGFLPKDQRVYRDTSTSRSQPSYGVTAGQLLAKCQVVL